MHNPVSKKSTYIKCPNSLSPALQTFPSISFTSAYKTWFQKFKEEKAVLEYNLNGIKKTKTQEEDSIIKRLLPNLGNLYEIYEKSNITQKHTLIRGVFKDSLLWGEGSFRTAFTDPVFYYNLLKIKEKELLFHEQPFRNSDNFPFCTPSRRNIELIY